jgi:F-type H+-transporting ATPase subunit gamma
LATLRDIRRRIHSVEKTQQITSAMRMVAAAKLRRAQDAIIAARPYADQMFATLEEIGRRALEAEHPLLEQRPNKRAVEVVVVTSDRGLCGAFNSNAVKRAEALIAEFESRFESVSIALVGRKGLDYFRRRRAARISRTWTGIATVEYRHAAEIAGYVSERFVAGDVDEVVFVYSEFVSALVQEPRVLHALPIVPEASNDGAEVGDEAVPYDIEPDAKTLYGLLLPNALDFNVYRVLLESQAGEQAARMTAMESATRNTEELIRNLTLQFNRARQAAITKELVEIVTGAQALE